MVKLVKYGRGSIVGAKVTLRLLGSDERFVVKSGANGIATFENLPAGTYRVSVKGKGGAKAKALLLVDEASESITLKVGKRFDAEHYKRHHRSADRD
jgi:hypothetical protein